MTFFQHDGFSETAPFGGASCPGVIDQNMSHRLGGSTQKMLFSRVGNVPTQQLQVSLVNQRGGLQRMDVATPIELLARELSER